MLVVSGPSSSGSSPSVMSGTVGRERPAVSGACWRGVFWGVGAVRSGPWLIGRLEDIWRRQRRKEMEERKKKDFEDLCSVLPTVPRDEKQSRRSFGLCHPRLISPKIPLENPNFIRLSSLSQSTSVKLSQRAQFLRLDRALKPLQMILAGWAIDCWTTPSHDRGHHRYPHIYWPSWVRGSIRDDAMAYWTLPRALPSPWIHVVVLNRKLTRLQSPVRRTTGPPLPTRSSCVLESVTASKVPLAVDAGSRPIGERCIVPDI